MKMLEKYLLPKRMILVLLMLIGNSGIAFSAHSGILDLYEVQEDRPVLQASEVEEQAGDLFDSVLPTQKNLLFSKLNPGALCDFDSQILNHTSSSLNYIKRSRYLQPALGVKEVIYPFHVFL